MISSNRMFWSFDLSLIVRQGMRLLVNHKKKLHFCPIRVYNITVFTLDQICEQKDECEVCVLYFKS